MWCPATVRMFLFLGVACIEMFITGITITGDLDIMADISALGSVSVAEADKGLTILYS